MTQLRLLRQLVLGCALVLAAPLGALAADPAGDGFGVVVMAHGGSPDWNQSVLDAVAPLRDRHPVEVAFGMADACSLQEVVRKLEARGARRIGVVRLFISGESWYERTEQILGLREGAPPAAGAASAECAASGHDDHAHHRMAFFRLDASSSFALSHEGLLEAPEAGAILGERARGLSAEPEREDVLVLAHGPADDAENERWLAHLEARAATVRALGFRTVRVETLREDWPEKRAEAEQRLRSFVGAAASDGRRVIVLPFRLSGFGPYAKVLDGLTYAADQLGLLPHPLVTRWIERQTAELGAALPSSAEDRATVSPSCPSGRGSSAPTR